MTNQEYEKACVKGAGRATPQDVQDREIAELKHNLEMFKKQNRSIRKAHDKMAGKYGTLQQELSFAKERTYNAKLKLLVIGYLIGTVVTAVSAAVNINW